MTEKKMIEEMAKDIVRMAGLGVFEKAEYLINLGYRKIPEGSVVLSKEEIENWLKWVRQNIEKTRKETAKAFAQKLKFNLLNNSVIDDDCTLEDLEFGGDEIQEALNDTLKQFGVEVEE